MSVSLSVTAQTHTTVAATSFSNTGVITTVSGDTALTVTVAFDQTTGASSVSAPTNITWDSGGTNQSMTLLSSLTFQTVQLVGFTALYGLRNPAVGNKTLAIPTLTQSGFFTILSASWQGNDTSSDANCFPTAHRTNSQAANFTNPASLTVTIGSGNAGVAAAYMKGVSSGTESPAADQEDVAASGCDGCLQHKLNSNQTFTVNSNSAANDEYIYVGCEIAAAAAATTTGGTLPLMGVG